MKLKKFLSGVGTLCLILTLFLPLQVHAQEHTGSTTIKTTVPDTHIVLLDIGEHGSVFINGKTYISKDKQAEVARLAEQTYTIQPDKGWQVEQVRYGQKDALEAVKLTDNAFTAPALNSNDNQLRVTFKKDPAGSGTDKPGSGGSTGVQTGDSTNIALYGMAMAFSFFLSAVLIHYRQQKR